MQYRTLIYFFTLIGISILLVGCIGGGGSGSGSGGDGIITEITDDRVSTVSLLVTDNFQPANGNSPISLTIIARDQTNIPLADVEVSLASTSDFAVFITPTGTTEANGRFTTGVVSSKAETLAVTATAGGRQSEPVDVTFIAPVDGIEITASEEALAVGESTTVTITIYKVRTQEISDSEPLPNAPFNVTVSGSAVVNNIPELTDINGQATFTVTNNQAEMVTVTVSSGLLTQTLPLFFGATLELLPKLTNTIDELKLTALLKDGNNAPLDGQTVTFNFINSNNETLSPNTAITLIDGTAEVTIMDLAKDGGMAQVKASSGTLDAEATVNFKSNFQENRQLAVETTAQVLTTNQSATITAYVTDNKDLPIEWQPVSFSAITADGEETHAQILPNTGESDSEGEVETKVSIPTNDNIIVTVQADTAKQEIPLYFGANIHLSPTEADSIANGITPLSLTAIVSDAQGVGIAGIPVNVRVTNGIAFVDDFRPSTDKLGRATINVTSDTLGDVTIEAQADNLPKASAILTFNPSEPDSLTINTSADSLSFNSEDVPITVVVKDAQSNFVKNGTKINFTTTLGVITETALTNKGTAEAQFSPNMQAGLATITATAGTATESLTLTVQPDTAGTIEVSQIEPKVIGIIGSGVVQSATIEFLVKDNLGNPVADDTPVDFALGSTTLGGGEIITTQGEGSTTATGTTNNGLVSVILKSGAVAGNIDIIATVNETISTVARVIIVGGSPDAAHFSMAAEFLNIAGGVRFGLFDEITAYVGDRFGNIVPDGTSVSFITEGGMIGESIGGGAFTTTTKFGQATATLQSAAPTTPNLGGKMTFSNSGFECFAPNYAYTNEPQDLCGNPGLVTIVAYTSGSESFADTNGNGQHDADEPHDDLSEPYIDGNDNFTFDVGELYIDVNGNGKFDEPDDVFQANTTIWNSMRVLFSDRTANFRVTPQHYAVPQGCSFPAETAEGCSFVIPNGNSETFIIDNIGDIYGNALVGGTKFEVTTNNGILGGETNFEFGDTNAMGNFEIGFTLASNPATQIKEKDEDDKESVRQEYPLPSSATITITITSTFQNQAPGGNGDLSLAISGTINQP